MSSVVTIYLLLIISSVIIYETTLAVFERIDGSYLSFVLPSAISFVESVACMPLAYYKVIDMEDGCMTQTLVLASCWLGLIGCAVILAIVRREAASQREAAETALAARRIKHTRDEVESLALRAKGMSSLRHALANDIRAVRRLAEAGSVAEANQRLLRLQEQAHILNK